MTSVVSLQFDSQQVEPSFSTTAFCLSLPLQLSKRCKKKKVLLTSKLRNNIWDSFIPGSLLLINLTLALSLFTFFKYRPCMISLSWAGGGDWDYVQISMCSQSTSQRECAFVGHAGCCCCCCWSVLYIDCCTWAVIRLSAKQRRRQTRLIMAVFISTYVTTVTFFIHIGEDNHS